MVYEVVEFVGIWIEKENTVNMIDINLFKG